MSSSDLSGPEDGECVSENEVDEGEEEVVDHYKNWNRRRNQIDQFHNNRRGSGRDRVGSDRVGLGLDRGGVGLDRGGDVVGLGPDVTPDRLGPGPETSANNTVGVGAPHAPPRPYLLETVVLSTSFNQNFAEEAGGGKEEVVGVGNKRTSEGNVAEEGEEEEGACAVDENDGDTVVNPAGSPISSGPDDSLGEAPNDNNENPLVEGSPISSGDEAWPAGEEVVEDITVEEGEKDEVFKSEEVENNPEVVIQDQNREFYPDFEYNDISPTQLPDSPEFVDHFTAQVRMIRHG